MFRSPSVRAVLVSALMVAPQYAAAQSADSQFHAGIHVAAARSGEFEKTDFGIGGLLSWRPGGLFGADAELTFYPSDFADEPAFSASRVEGLFGVTIGPRIGSIRPFAKFRPGFVRFAEAPEPFACILIFPPPLAFGRVDAGDRLVKYPGPVIQTDGSVQDESFFGHDFRVQIGGGVRF
jgi:hypothetical protein